MREYDENTSETLIVFKVSFCNFARPKKIVVQEKILQKSADMFLNIGVKSVTMDEIAQELGISKKTIYTYFPTKIKLIEATTIFVFNEISQGIAEIRAENKNPIAEHFLIKDFALRLLKNEKSSPQYQLQKFYPKIYSMIKTKQQKLLEDCLTQNLQKGVQEGLYRQEIPLSFTGRMFVLGIIGIKDPDLFPEDQFSVNELVSYHLEYHLQAIVTDKGLETLQNILKNQPFK